MGLIEAATTCGGGQGDQAAFDVFCCQVLYDHAIPMLTSFCQTALVAQSCRGEGLDGEGGTGGVMLLLLQEPRYVSLLRMMVMADTDHQPSYSSAEADSLSIPSASARSASSSFR